MPLLLPQLKLVQCCALISWAKQWTTTKHVRGHSHALICKEGTPAEHEYCVRVTNECAWPTLRQTMWPWILQRITTLHCVYAGCYFSIQNNSQSQNIPCKAFIETSLMNLCAAQRQFQLGYAGSYYKSSAQRFISICTMAQPWKGGGDEGGWKWCLMHCTANVLRRTQSGAIFLWPTHIFFKQGWWLISLRTIPLWTFWVWQETRTEWSGSSTNIH